MDQVGKVYLHICKVLLLMKRAKTPTYTSIFARSYQVKWYSSSVLCDYTNGLMVETLHAKSLKDGSLRDLQMNNHLLSLLVKSSNMHSAHKLFDEIPVKDVRSWTILLSGLAQKGHPSMVLELFVKMQIEGVCPNHFTLSSVFKCCSSLCELSSGKAIHGWILTNCIAMDNVLENAILDLYVKCGAFRFAMRFFEFMKCRDVVSWNIMIGAYLQMGEVKKCVDLFRSLPFKDVATWNTVLDGLMRNGLERFALELLYDMVDSGPPFNIVTYSTALVLVSSLSILKLGKEIHNRVLRFCIHDDGFIRNSVIDMYCKCGEVRDASAIFRKVQPQNSTALEEIIARSSIVSGYVRNGEYEEALKTFSSMVSKHAKVDGFTLASIISVCANTRNLGYGRQVHSYIMKNGETIDAHLGSSLIHMYGKSGSLNDAELVFGEISNRNVVIWSSMISVCAFHGKGKEALQLFENMTIYGVRPNEVTFIGILTACSHAGDIREGNKYFSLMKDYNIKPEKEHFTCMVDLYGRAGRLNEAKEFIDENNISHLSAVMKCFMSYCHLHKNVEMEDWVSKRVFELEPRDAGPYVMLSNMLANTYKWDEVARVRSFMKCKGLDKIPAQSILDSSS